MVHIEYLYGLSFSHTGCVGTTYLVNKWPFCLLAMSCWWRWVQMTRTTTRVLEQKSHKSEKEIKVGTNAWVSRDWRSLQPFCCELHHKCLISVQTLTYLWNRYSLRWPADRSDRHLLFSQLSNLLSSSNIMSVVDRGKMSAPYRHATHHMFHTGFCSALLLIYLVFAHSCQLLRSLLIKWWRLHS